MVILPRAEDRMRTWDEPVRCHLESRWKAYIALASSTRGAKESTDHGFGFDTNSGYSDAITASVVQTAAYMGIIVWEAAAALVLVYAMVLWITFRRSLACEAPRRMASIGLLMLVILFMGGIITMGGEWFQMWRLESWNGLQPAFQNSVLALMALILIHLPSPLWAEMDEPQTSAQPASSLFSASFDRN